MINRTITRSFFLQICFTLVVFCTAQEKKSVQGAVGAVTIDGKTWNQIALRPVIPVWKFGVALDLVIYIDAEGNIHKDEWDFSNGTAIKNTLIDKIYYIRFGQRGDPLYFKIGSLDYVELGYGILVDGYSNSILYPQVRKIGLELSAKKDKYFVQSFTNDFKENLGLTGIRLQTPVLGGLPLGITAVLDRNQYLGLKDRDRDGRPDLVDDFPNNDSYWLDSDDDGRADNHPLEFDRDGDDMPDVYDRDDDGSPSQEELDAIHFWWDELGNNVGTDFSQETYYDSIPDPYPSLKPNPFNVHNESDPVGALAVDIGLPLIYTEGITVAMYAQAAKLLGETKNPKTGENQSLGIGIIPLGVAMRFGPARFNLEYRVIPDGRFEFGYWNQSYEIERAVFFSNVSSTNSTENPDPGTIISKESRLGRFGKLKGFYARFGVDLGSLVTVTTAYQNLHGDIWNEEIKDFSNESTQNVSSTVELKKSISRIKTAQLYYQQRNVPKPFDFEFTESTILGYRVGLELGTGLILNYVFQRSFRDVNGDGDVKDKDETINITTIETSFSF